ncbi:TIGR00375 family protein [Virgibacillus necropolis]|uniref:TIGR00375 family protein n=1 Tax=Virgibacillus necropolis TaxID=163877 RepID=A0A221MI93_9BACI|nr:TIGR00375 family protein [Virgibacillus necropolis]
MESFFADLHIHIGRDMYDKPVKITGAKSLTLTNILLESSRNKGIHLVGIIDSHAPHVQQELKQLLANNQARELEDGGIQFEDVTLILGSEIEVNDENCQGPVHVLCYLPTLAKMEEFTEWLATKMTNINLSSQRYYGTAKALQYKVKELDGLFIPAHVFTPFKSTYGKGVKQSLEEVFDPDLIDAVELGLSSDTSMADQIEELHAYTFVSNSDAHSLGKIAREYQEIEMEEPSFKELNWALHQVKGRKISRNFGMNPKLGKYHTTVCSKCLEPLTTSVKVCPTCGSTKIVKGVYDRIKELANENVNKVSRPPYMYQVPLEYLPSLGPKTYGKLLENFNTEMNIIHQVPLNRLEEVVPEKLARAIIQMRNGELAISAGGGGKYGSINPS